MKLNPTKLHAINFANQRLNEVFPKIRAALADLHGCKVRKVNGEKTQALAKALNLRSFEASGDPENLGFRVMVTMQGCSRMAWLEVQARVSSQDGRHWVYAESHAQLFELSGTLSDPSGGQHLASFFTLEEKPHWVASDIEAAENEIEALEEQIRTLKQRIPPSLH